MEKRIMNVLKKACTNTLLLKAKKKYFLVSEKTGTYYGGKDKEAVPCGFHRSGQPPG